VVERGESARVAVAERDALVVAPDEHAQRQLDPDLGVVGHQRRAGARVAEDDDLLGGELHAGLAGCGGVVDAGEHGEAVALDRGEQRGERFGVTTGASRDDHRPRIVTARARDCDSLGLSRGNSAACAVRRPGRGWCASFASDSRTPWTANGGR
jgi:hypothetical protein